MDLLPEYDPRVFFAAERTFLAWIRTAAALMGFGFVMARLDLFPGDTLSVVAGVGVIVVSVAFILAAARIYVATVRRLRAGEPFEGTASRLALALAGVLAVLGVALVALLVV